jgi:hypothetical protein
MEFFTCAQGKFSGQSPKTRAVSSRAKCMHPTVLDGQSSGPPAIRHPGFVSSPLKVGSVRKKKSRSPTDLGPAGDQLECRRGVTAWRA